MLASLLALSVTAAPLDIRILERDRLTEALVEADSMSCDGKKLPNRSISVTPHDRRLRAGDQACEALVAEGDLRVIAGERKRRYFGKLKVSNEAEVLRFVTSMDVETYLPSVVEAEASGFPPTALEAQAVVSRTFAVASRGRHAQGGYDLCDLAHCQVFRGHDEESQASRAAVKKTTDQVLLVGGVVLRPAFFHATCGGATSKAIDVFGEEGAGGGVNDTSKDGALCKDAPGFAWEWQVDRMDLAAALGSKPDGDLSGFEILRRDGAGRVIQLRSFGKRYSGVEFVSRVGRTFGWQALKSLKVTMEQVEGTLRFKGTGLGHGVGLCQHGAKALGTKGMDAKSILSKYFPDSQIRPIP